MPLSKKIKQFLKKLLKQKNKWEWDSYHFDNNKEDYLPCSTDINEDFFDTLLISTENEKQSNYSCLETSEYLVFISFELFQKYLYKNKIIEYGRIHYNSKNKRLKSILGFLEAHIGSYFNMYCDGEKYFKENNAFDLQEHRAKSYENDFNVWFHEVNLYCEKFKIKYIWSYLDLKDYFKKNIAFKYVV
ncbi:14726_t:CDS:1 [Gigaspora margarita]|uniref:14726_t:CDS:1 n=1 Tax=Gigaspora margarita TaxID=4874 RepID=A0ABM8W755_GIGMA|nr:14726_t:CDS:1 [Gigaspora margarita]